MPQNAAATLLETQEPYIHNPGYKATRVEAGVVALIVLCTQRVGGPLLLRGLREASCMRIARLLQVPQCWPH